MQLTYMKQDYKLHSLGKRTDCCPMHICQGRALHMVSSLSSSLATGPCSAPSMLTYSKQRGWVAVTATCIRRTSKWQPAIKASSSSDEPQAPQPEESSQHRSTFDVTLLEALAHLAWVLDVWMHTPEDSVASGERPPWLTTGYVQKLLVAVLGDLDSVWTDRELMDVLLGLPHRAAVLLLSSSQIQVDTEDAVYYVVEQYIYHNESKLTEAEQRSIAELVRVPFLSNHCFALIKNASKLATHERSSYVFKFLQKQVEELAKLRTDEPTGYSILSDEALAKIEGVPDGWLGTTGPRWPGLKRRKPKWKPDGQH